MKRSRTPKKAPRAAAFPTRDEVLDFIAETPGKVGKREIARAFRIKGSDRVRLKALIKGLQEDGHLESRNSKKPLSAGHLPPVLVVLIHDIDIDGDLVARPAAWDEDTPAPRILLAPERKLRPALAPGDRVLARLSPRDDGTYEAETIRRLEGGPRLVLGIYESGPEGGRLRPTDKKARKDFLLHGRSTGGAEPGELVMAEVLPEKRGGTQGLRSVRVVERLGDLESPKALSLIAIHEHGLPLAFPPESVALAEQAGPVSLDNRDDLRGLPLVTIDGPDARDFDDAVFAEPDGDAGNPKGWHLVVAIADVAHYVRPGDALDRAARARGNSAYFPDRVVPLLPEALSNKWCSLVPGEDRPCLAAHLSVDAKGRLLKWRFVRGLMRSAARLTYEQVQAAHDGQVKDGQVKGQAAALRDSVIAPLYGAFHALTRERTRRGTLDLDIAERQVILEDSGQVREIRLRERLDSHRLIEEFMITANVAAARELERLRQPCMYRVHDKPDPVKLEALSEVLTSFGLRLAKGQVVRPKTLTALIGQVAGHPDGHLVSELILRAQAQAVYSPENHGHFGLALPQYAHFTSPIRRYADLLVHRALIAGLKLGAGALPPDAAAEFAELGESISACERRAAAAERDTVDRFTSLYLKERTGAVLPGRISGVTRAGLFIELDETGADGLVPMRSLPDDYYDHDIARHQLVGRRWGRSYTLGGRVTARVREANPITGGLLLELVEGEDDADEPAGDPASRPAAKRKPAARKTPARKAAAHKAAGRKGKRTGRKKSPARR